MMLAPAAPWHGWRGGLLVIAGIMMVLVPPQFTVRRSWVALAALFLLFSVSALLPAAWFHTPAWRQTLLAAGAGLSGSVTAHALQTLEGFGALAVTLVTMLYLTGHRTDHRGNQILATLFAVAVAVVALFALGAKELKWVIPWDREGSFGFFLNRNHMASLLVMGTAAGFAVAVQSIRFKTWGTGIPALGAVLVCGWTTLGYSESRGGVILLVCLFLTWMMILGREYVRGRVLVAVAILAAAGVYHFAARDSMVKSRLDDTAERVGELAGMGVESGTPGAPGPELSVQSLDLRVPIFEDTFQMIAAAPWTGFGLGQFGYVFPQYRRNSAYVNDHKSVHPESDWLQTAAESGIPAALTLGALVLLIGWTALRSAVTGRARALRTGCLLGAAVVPLHGIFDVPGHRMELVWPACLLLAISLRTTGFGPASRLTRWFYRFAGMGVAAAGLYLVIAQWHGGNPPATLVPGRAVEQVGAVFAEEAAEEKAAAERNQTLTGSEERYQKCLTVLDEALKVAPMDAQLHGLRGTIATLLAGREKEADRSFTIQRMLDPTWVAIAFHQAAAWASFDPSRTADLWLEGMERATALQQMHPARTPLHYGGVSLMMRDSLLYPNLIPFAVWAAEGHEDRFIEWASRASVYPLNRAIPELLKQDLTPGVKAALFKLWCERGTRAKAEAFAKESAPELLQPPPAEAGAAPEPK